MSEALLVAASEHKNIILRHELCRGKARSIGEGHKESEIPRDLAPEEGEISRDLFPGGRNYGRGAKSLEHRYIHAYGRPNGSKFKNCRFIKFNNLIHIQDHKNSHSRLLNHEHVTFKTSEFTFNTTKMSHSSLLNSLLSSHILSLLNSQSLSFLNN